MLPALLLLAMAPTSQGLAAPAAAFDAACVTPGADQAAQRAAILRVARPAGPVGKGSEGFDGPAGRYMLLRIGRIAMCGLNMQIVTVEEPGAWLEARYRTKVSKRTARGGAESYTWSASGRAFKLTLAGTGGPRLALFTATDER